MLKISSCCCILNLDLMFKFIFHLIKNNHKALADDTEKISFAWCASNLWPITQGTLIQHCTLPGHPPLRIWNGSGGCLCSHSFWEALRTFQNVLPLLTDSSLQLTCGQSNDRSYLSLKSPVLSSLVDEMTYFLIFKSALFTKCSPEN